MTLLTSPPTYPNPHLDTLSNVQVFFDHDYAAALTRSIAAAASSVFIAQYHFRVGHRPTQPLAALLTAILDAAGRGLTIRVLINHTTRRARGGTDPGTLRATLTHPHITIREHASDQILHTKLVIIDHATLYIGSHNLSNAALTTSRNISLAIHSPHLATKLLGPLERLWEDAAHG